MGEFVISEDSYDVYKHSPGKAPSDEDKAKRDAKWLAALKPAKGSYKDKHAAQIEKNNNQWRKIETQYLKDVKAQKAPKGLSLVDYRHWTSFRQDVKFPRGTDLGVLHEEFRKWMDDEDSNDV